MREKENRTYEKKIGDALKEMKKKEVQLQREMERQEKKKTMVSDDKSSESKTLKDKIERAHDMSNLLFDQILQFIKEFYGQCVMHENVIDGNVNIEVEKQENEENSLTTEDIVEKMIKIENISIQNHFLADKGICSRIFSYLLKRNSIGFELVKNMYNQKLSQKEAAIRKAKQDANIQARDLKRTCDDRVRSLRKKLTVSMREKDDIKNENQLKCEENGQLQTKVTKLTDDIFNEKKDLARERNVVKRLESEKNLMQDKIRECEKDVQKVIFTKWCVKT